MPRRNAFPPVRACIFDMDGLIFNTEDMYTLCHNEVLARYGRGPMTWEIKHRLQGRPAAEANALLLAWAGITDTDVSPEEYTRQLTAVQTEMFPTCDPLPGVEKLLRDLSSESTYTIATSTDSKTTKVHLALATASRGVMYDLKTQRHETLMRVFEKAKVVGDDPRFERGKPSPDIYQLALKLLNDSLGVGEKEIKPEECVVFEDGIPGVEAGRRAGMRVVWVPHPGLAKLYVGKEAGVLAGRDSDTTVDVHELGELDDGWAELRPTLEDFPYEQYGIQVGPSTAP